MHTAPAALEPTTRRVANPEELESRERINPVREKLR